MKLKKWRVLFLMITLLGVMIIPASAAQTISAWCSDSERVSYNPYDGSYYIYNYSSDSLFTGRYQDAVRHAKNQWNAYLPFNITETSFNNAISYIYGGSYSQLKGTFPNLPLDAAGLAVMNMSGFAGYVSVVGSTVERPVYKLSAGNKACVVNIPFESADNLKTVATHEVGHLYGWNGHSTSDNDIMTSGNYATTTLTFRDYYHIKQIYDIFY